MQVLALIKGSCGAFDYFIENQVKEEVIVMGHTHEPVAKMCVLSNNATTAKQTPHSHSSYRYFRKGSKARELGPQVAYVNSGAWVTGGTFTYVDTIYECAAHLSLTCLLLL